MTRTCQYEVQGMGQSLLCRLRVLPVHERRRLQYLVFLMWSDSEVLISLRQIKQHDLGVLRQFHVDYSPVLAAATPSDKPLLRQSIQEAGHRRNDLDHPVREEAEKAQELDEEGIPILTLP